ncbi:hypothetical protein M426DRAFT_7862 [Hypoxylon sp. CI-4A]|nr:hypothetical protein M426DRAFT_7862 [Hypoxylon sp. CI-4A]
MQYFPATRRLISSVAIALCIVVYLTNQSSLPLRGLLVWTLDPTISPSCQVWPGRQGSGLERLSYGECHDATDQPLVGDVGALGNPERCLLAGSRFDQYYSSPSRNWSEVRWGQVQRRCASRESRLSPLEYEINKIWRGSQSVEVPLKEDGDRVAIVLRAWDNYEYTEKRLAWLRALIAEVSLQRAGRYQVFFLVNVKDPNIHLEEDDTAYEQALVDFVPDEFRDMAVLFNERTLKAWYPLVEEHGAQDQMYQALQIFSQRFTQYDFIWQLEMDLRLTSHVHDSLQSAAAFARTQSRRNLWERNGQFYLPDLYGNSYENFSVAVDAWIGDTGIWGPVSTSDFTPLGSEPPPRTKESWGVGEEADLIGFMPMIDPVGTNWVYEDAVHGFADGTATPRRVAIVSITRSSRRLLQLVHEAQQTQGQWVVSEATLETFALLHGLKAVTIPHPISFDKKMTPEELDIEIHKGPPHSRAGGETPSMLYSKNGWVMGSWWEASYWFTGGGAEKVWNAYLDGKRLPPMLLHPVKEK